MVAPLYPKSFLKQFLLSEGEGQRSRENIVVTQSGAAVESGTLLTQAGDTAATGTFAAVGSPTGNPTMGSIVISAPAIPGDYQIQFTAATKFDIEDPNGKKIGNGTTGVAFSSEGVAFTITAGGTPAVAGDRWKLSVAAGNLKYVPYTAAEAAGPADAILYETLPAATGDAKCVGIVRDAEVNRFELTGLDAAAEARLLKRGILVRGKTVLGNSTPAL